MRIGEWKIALAPLLFVAVPFLAGCEPGAPRGEPTADDELGLEDGQPPTAQPPAREPPGAEQPTADISEAEIRTVARIYVRLAELQEEIDARADDAETSEERANVEEEAFAAMDGVLQEHGMTLEQYQQMMQLINTDPEARRAFDRMVAGLEG